MKITAASPTDLNVLVGMAALLWPYEPEAELASDCEPDNADSIAFHRAAGFSEAARVVCFVKGIGA